MTLRIWILFVMMGAFLGIQAQEPGINEFIYVDQEPAPQNLGELRKAIEYPAEAVEQEIQGTVVARILVNEEGQYVRHELVKDIHPLLSEAVEARLPDLRFTPAMLEGKPLMYWVNLPFPFKLVNAEEEAIRKNIETLTQELSADPENYILWHRRAVQRTDLGAFNDARIDFTEALSLNPKKNKKKKPESYRYLFYSHFGRGSVYTQLDELDKALADYNEALQVAKEMKANDSAVQATLSDVYLNRGYIFALQGEYEKATTDFDWVLTNAPDKSCNVYQFLADVGSATSDNSLLARAYDGLLECQPEEKTHFYSRGYYLSSVGKYEEAIEDMDTVLATIEVLPLKIAAHNRKGWCYLQMGDIPSAHAALDAAMGLNAVNNLSHYYLGLVLEVEGKPDEACQQMRKALYMGLEGDEGKEAITFLEDKCGGWEE